MIPGMELAGSACCINSWTPDLLKCDPRIFQSNCAYVFLDSCDRGAIVPPGASNKKIIVRPPKCPPDLRAAGIILWTPSLGRCGVVGNNLIVSCYCLYIKIITSVIPVARVVE